MTFLDQPPEWVAGLVPSSNSENNMYRTLLCASALCVCSVVSAAEPDPPTVKRKVDFDSRETDRVGGIVLTVSNDTILLTTEGKAPTAYPFHDCLAAGKIHKLVTDPRSYLASDVKVGDVVSISTHVENKQVFCVEISIWERPGGLVPPGQIVNKKMPFHERRNADIALRDKGTPIPEHLKPVAPTAPPPDKKK